MLVKIKNNDAKEDQVMGALNIGGQIRTSVSHS
jgi:hypothetical protein